MKFAAGVTLAFSIGFGAQAAGAETAPLPPIIRVIVPFSAGGGTDVIARAIAAQLAHRTGSNVIVENKPGASGMIGARAVATGPKDGSQVLVTSVSLFTTAATMRNAPIDVVKDLRPVSLAYEGPQLIAVSTKTDIKTPEDLVAAARAKPNGVTHGTAGVGTISHMAVETLNDAAGIQLRHIPYKGAAPAAADVAAGNVDMILAVYSNFAGLVESKRIRVIAVTSAEPSPFYPGVPPMASAAPGYEHLLWGAVFVPSGTPAAVVQRLNEELNEVSKTKEVQEVMHRDGLGARALTPSEMERYASESYAHWLRLAKEKNIVLE